MKVFCIVGFSLFFLFGCAKEEVKKTIRVPPPYSGTMPIEP